MHGLYNHHYLHGSMNTSILCTTIHVCDVIFTMLSRWNFQHNQYVIVVCIVILSIVMCYNIQKEVYIRYNVGCFSL